MTSSSVTGRITHVQRRFTRHTRLPWAVLTLATDDGAQSTLDVAPAEYRVCAFDVVDGVTVTVTYLQDFPAAPCRSVLTLHSEEGDAS